MENQTEVINQAAMIEILSQVDPACLSGDALQAACWWLLRIEDCPLYGQFNEEYQNRVHGR